MPIVSIRNTNIYQGENCVIEDLNFDLQPSEFVYLIGKTGSGKTSLLRTLYADLELQKGQVYVDDFQIHDLKRKQIPHLRRKLGIIFQDFELFTDRTVEENLYFVMKATGWISKIKMSQKVDELLEQVGLTGYQRRMPHQLSGGEKQRVAIARALINNPVLLLADEPTGNLNPVVANDILNLFIRISKEKGMAVLMATHHHNFLRTIPARVLYCDGGIVKDVSKAKVESRMEN